VEEEEEEMIVFSLMQRGFSASDLCELDLNSLPNV
jgi:hypothetical protein